MDPEEALVPDTRQPAPNVNVNVGNGRGIGSFGLKGIWDIAGNYTAMTIIVGLFVAVTIWNRVDANAARAQDRAERSEERTAMRAERVEERQLFRESIKDMNTEQNRRTGEVKGAVDINTAVMRELIAEFKASRGVGSPVPKPPSP